MYRKILIIACLIPLVLLAASHLGALHPLGDSLAVFRGPIAVVAGLAAGFLFLNRQQILAVMGVLLTIWSAYTVLNPRLGVAGVREAGAGKAGYALYQKNMSFRMADTGPLTEDIMANEPDFVTLEEVDTENLSLLQTLQDKYPSQVICPFRRVGGVAVMSRWPKVAGSEKCLKGKGVVAMQVKTPDGPVWVVALHLHWAYPFGQAAQVGQIVPLLRGLKGPVVLGGDFNMVPWSDTMQRITSATRAERVGQVQYTFELFDGLYTIPIDHVLAPQNGRFAEVSKRPKLGSDHFGLLARFDLR